MENKAILISILFIAILILPIDVFAQENFKSISDCDSINNEFRKIDCYAQFAKQNNDVLLCFKGKTDDGYEEGECVSQVAVLNKDILVCDNINSKNLPQNSRGDTLRQKCIAQVGISLNDKTICNKVTNNYWKTECFKGIKENEANILSQKIRKVSSYAFYVSVVFIIFLSVMLALLKTNFIKILTVLAFLLSFAVALSRCSFLWAHFIPGIADNDANLHSIILLFYGIFCFVVLLLNLNRSFNEWKNNNAGFKIHIKLTYLYAILFSLIISLLSSVNYSSTQFNQLSILGGGGSILFFLGIFSIIYTKNAWSLKQIKQKGFLEYTQRMSTLFVLFGAIPAFFVIYFWLFGMPRFNM